MYIYSDLLLSLQSPGSSLVSQSLHYPPSFDLSISIIFQGVLTALLIPLITLLLILSPNRRRSSPSLHTHATFEWTTIVSYLCLVNLSQALLVQDNTWDGPLSVVRYIARGGAGDGS